ncbi:hypothetical protein [Leisingera sp. F5]|uniref:hypothetical protein n=1 Tax=Leisingera sp. F5 TaxID=1813816 RepID=UPI000ABDB3B4|nr:hypothetical protein [Leisingera sp. F5]
MSFFGAIFNRTNLMASAIGGACSVVGVLAALNQGSIDKAVSANEAFTVLREQLTAQQRQLDAFERRQSSVLTEVRREQEALRKEALVHGSELNKMAMRELEKRFEALSVKIENLPKTAGGGVDRMALNKAVEQVKLDLTDEFQRWIAELPAGENSGVSEERVRRLFAALKGQLEGEVLTLVNAKLSSLPAKSGEGVPVATKRRIHFVEKDCIYLQSMPSQFTVKFKYGQEFCWKPSVLWSSIKSAGYTNGFVFEFVGGGREACVHGNTCYIGTEDDGTKYKVRIEKYYAKEGARYFEVNFLKMG